MAGYLLASALLCYLHVMLNWHPLSPSSLKDHRTCLFVKPKQLGKQTSDTVYNCLHTFLFAAALSASSTRTIELDVSVTDTRQKKRVKSSVKSTIDLPPTF